MKLYTTVLILLISTSGMFAQTNWKIDKSHSKIRFTTTHMMISEVEGQFNEFDATVVSKSEDFDGSEVSFTAKVASIDTDNERRDNHLKSDDFFNAEAHPELKFSGKIEKDGEQYHLVGDLTIRDVTKPVKFDVKYGGQIEGRRGKKSGFKVTGSIKRFDYGIKFNRALETGGLVVGDEVEFTANVEMNEAKE